MTQSMKQDTAIVVLDGGAINPGDNPWIGLDELGTVTVFDDSPPTKVTARAQGADAIIVNKIEIGADALEKLPNLSLIAVSATGYDCIDIDAAADRGITVCNVPEYGTDSVAQFVFALILNHCHHVAQHSAAVAEGKWQQHGSFSFWETPQVELAGRVMGIIGLGRIGRRVAEIASALGMRVLAHDVKRTAKPTSIKHFAWASMETVFTEADVVSLHVPLTPATTYVVNSETLRQMKPTALLINAARGGLISERDLADALSNGEIAGAALDVLSQEPMSDTNPLLAAPNLTITPHMAWATLAARQRLMAQTVTNVRRYLSGNPTNVVN